MSGNSNIKVAIRVRPLISREKSDKLKEQWEVNENSIYPIDVTTGKRYGDVYHFDHIFDSTCCNLDIYNTLVHPVVDKAVNGFNGTIFAYGQTSSGKTYTMMGSSQEDGIISIAIQNIFLAIDRSINKKFLLRVSYLEIYNEKLYDLLDIKNIVKISEDCYGSVKVNVKEEVTDCAERVYDIMKKGDKTRRIEETNMNEKSSRSHTIFRIIIESSDNSTGIVNVAHLDLVDLAGSERATLTKATGLRLKEGAHINKSLSTLSLVMKQLSDSQDFINYRDSKLTRILRPSLGGNSLTAIICGVTPAALEETHSTLAFASRAKTVKNKPLLNEIESDKAQINRFALEIDKLKHDLEMANDKRNLQAQKITMLEKCILFSKKTNNNINRRKTWSAPHDSNKALPVIYETDVLRLSDQSSVDSKTDTISSSQNLPSEMNDYSSETNSSIFFEKNKLPSFMSPGPENITLPELILTDETDQTPTKKSEEVVKWLVNSIDTPKFEHKERADYYEFEFKSLKELTTKEKLLLTTENTTEVERLKLELNCIKNELECERKIKNEQELSFLHEKNMLHTKLEKLKNTNDSLSKLVENVKKNDCEFLAEMYKDKYKKREKELLDSLQEARDLLESNTNNTDDEKTLEIWTDLSSINEFLEKCKNHLNFLKSELESNLTVSVFTVEKLFEKIKMLTEDLLINSTNSTEEVEENLNVFKYMLDLAFIVFGDDTLIFEVLKEKQRLANRVSYFENKEKTYELLVSKQDEEIKHLSDNILQYMKELDLYKSEVTKYKDMAMNSSNVTNDTTNMTDLNNSTRHNYNLITDQYTQIEENFRAIIQSKDKEIEDLSDKIMEYIEQLTSLEQEFNKFKSDQTENNEQCLNYVTEIADKNKLISENNNFNEELKIEIRNLQSEVKILKVQVKKDKDLLEIIELKDNEIRELKEKNSTNTDINSLQIKYDKLEETLPKLKFQIKINKELVEAKNKEIEKLISETALIFEELTFIQNHLKIYNESKDKTIAELTEKETSYIKQLSEIQEKYEKIIKSEKRNTDKLENHKSYIQESNNDDVQELTSKCPEVEKKCKIEMQEENKLIQIKEEQIIESNCQTVKFTEKVSVLNIDKDIIREENKEIHEELIKLNFEENISDYDPNKITENDIIIAKNKEIEDLCTKIEVYINLLSSLEKKTGKYEFDLKNQKDMIQNKNSEIEELSTNIIICKNNLLLTEEEVNKYKSDLKFYEDLIAEFCSMSYDFINNVSSTDEQKHLIQSKYPQNVNSRDDTIFPMKEKLEECKHHLKIIQYIIDLKNDKIENITELLDKFRSKNDEQINALQTNLNTKEEVIVFLQTDNKNLNEIINQRTKDLQEWNQKKLIEMINSSSQTQSLEELKQSLIQPEAETWNNKIRLEETKSVQFLQRIKDLEEQLQSLNKESILVREEYESTQNTNLQYIKMHENLKRQICNLQKQLTQQDCTLKQCRDFIYQLEQDKAKMLENNTLLKETSILEIKKLSEKLQEKCNYIESIQKEIVNLQHSNSNLVQDIAKIKKKNEDYKKIVEQVTEKANSKITNYNDVLIKLKKDNEQLKVQVNSEKETNKKLQFNQRVLREELEKRNNELNSGADLIKFHTKINDLEIQNKALTKLIEDYQVQIYAKGCECNNLKINLESLRNENLGLQNVIKDLNRKLFDSEDLLKTAKVNMYLLEKEKENYSDNVRVLENSLEDIKFELHTLKNKEREKIKKVKRQSLHDSSRSLSSDEHANVIDENQPTHHQPYDLNKSVESKPNEIEKKERLPLANKELNEHDKLAIENEKLRKTNQQLRDLCRLRKVKIDELIRKIE